MISSVRHDKQDAYAFCDPRIRQNQVEVRPIARFLFLLIAEAAPRLSLRYSFIALISITVSYNLSCILVYNTSVTMAGLARHVDPEEIIEKLRLGDDKAHHHRIRVKPNDASSSLTPC